MSSGEDNSEAAPVRLSIPARLDRGVQSFHQHLSMTEHNPLSAVPERPM
jgi:hypothetical protein